MHIARHLVIWFLITLGVVLPPLLFKPVTLQYTGVLGDLVGTNVPAHVQAGLPFVVRDSYATQVCISSRSGQPLPPFVAPADRFSFGAPTLAPTYVQAGVPFMLQDSNGTQICVSTRRGQVLPPFVVP